MFRIVFFGLPLGAVLLARDGHDIALAALSRAEIGARRLRRAIGDERVLVRPSTDDPALVERVRALRPDLLVSWFWTRRLPMRIVELARLGGIGVHPSLLPRHRGPDPTAWAIASGDAVTGVTVHRIEADYDTGDILAQHPLRIDPSWNAWQLARALDRPSLELLRATVERLSRGEALSRTPQDPERATAAPFFTDAERAIVWSWPSARIVRHVRALAPSPGAWTEVRSVVITLARVEEVTRFPAALAPGEGAVVDGRAVVRTGDTAVALLAGEILDERDPADERDGAGAWRVATASDLAALFLLSDSP